MNFFKLYPGDYMRDTGTLTMTEHGAYLLMLMHFYATQKPLPETPLLYRMLRVYKPTEKRAVDTILRLFWIRNEVGFISKRAQSDVEKFIQRSEANRLIALEREATKRATNGAPSEHETLHETSTSRIQNPETIKKEEELREEKKKNKTPVRASRKTGLPDGFKISERVRKWADEKGHTQLDRHLEYFRGYAIANGKTYTDWDQAFINAIMGDWAKLNIQVNGNGYKPTNWKDFPA